MISRTSMLLRLAALLALPATDGVAEDYLLQLNVTGHVERPNDPEGEQAADDDPLHRVELLVRPGLPFHCRSTIGNETVLVSGMLRVSEDGRIRVDVKYHHERDTGTKTLVAEGIVKKLPEKTSATTTLVVPLGTRTCLGGLATTSTRPLPDRTLATMSKHVVWITVAKWTGPED